MKFITLDIHLKSFPVKTYIPSCIFLSWILLKRNIVRSFSFLFVARLKNCFLYFSQQLGFLYVVYIFYFILPVLATKEKSTSVYYIEMKTIFLKYMNDNLIDILLVYCLLVFQLNWRLNSISFK